MDNKLLERIINGLDKLNQSISNLKEDIQKVKIHNANSFINEDEWNNVYHILEKYNTALKKNLNSEFDGLKTKFDSIPSEKEIKNYILFGTDGVLKTKCLLIAIFTTLVVISSVLYLPTFFTDFKKLKEELNQKNQLLNYIYFKEFEKKNIQQLKNIEDWEQAIISKNTVILKDYNRIRDKYLIEVKKRNLEKQLNELNSKK